MNEIQIPNKLMADLIDYFYPDEPADRPTGWLADEIREQIEEKMQRVTNRVLFTRYKTAKTFEEREQARRAYLKERGFSEAFISDTEKPYEEL